MWKTIRILRPEMFKSPDNLMLGLVVRLDQTLHFIRKFLNPAVEFKSSKDYERGKGMHGQGIAINGTMLIGEKTVPLAVQWMISERYGFGGIGLHVSTNELHWDIRSEVGKPEDRWWRWHHCPKCSHKNQIEAKSCSKCTTLLSRSMTDPNLWLMLAAQMQGIGNKK